MNAADLTFGIEMETTIPAGAIAVGCYHGSQPAQGLPAGWVAMRDGSIAAPAGREGCEFVSPVLQGTDGVRSVMAAVAAIKALGGEVNSSCGFHVHVGWQGDAKALDRLITLTANFEKALYASTGTKKRERSRWCASVRELGTPELAKNVDRYRILNLRNLMEGRRPTVEFRAFGGTLNIEKILAHVRVCLGLVERAMKAKRTAAWVGKTPDKGSPQHRSGEGQTQLTRLFYQLGWIKGRTSHTFGWVEAEGATTLKNSKRTLMKLARKYDRGAEETETGLETGIRRMVRRRRRSLRSAILANDIRQERTE